jgi:hypothetical protein
MHPEYYSDISYNKQKGLGSRGIREGPAAPGRKNGDTVIYVVDAMETLVMYTLSFPPLTILQYEVAGVLN